MGDLAARQAAAGHEVHVLTATLGVGGERGGVVDLEDGVHVHRLGARLPFDLPVNPVGPRLMREAFADLRPDVVHVHATLQVDDSPALATGTQRRGQDVHLVPGGGLPRGEVTHLRLDPTGTRRVAVGDVDDQHGVTVTA